MSLKQGSRTTVTAGGNLNIGRGGSDPFINAPGTGGIDLTGAGSNLAGIRADIYKKGSFIRSTMTSLDGEVSPRSFRFITYANAADFEKAVNANIGVWAHRMAKRAHRTEYDAGGERRKAVIEATLQRIDAFVKDAVNRADPKEEFSQYLELSEPAVKKINHLQGMADFMRQAGDKKQAEKLEREITRTFEAADSWEESFLVLGERSSAQESTGLHTGVRWTATLAKIQSKLHVFV